MAKVKKDKYTTNFVERSSGNSIKQNSELIVRVNGAEAVTGEIRQNGSPIIIDQSSSRDEDNNAETVNFVLKRRRWRGLRKDTLPPGDYELRIWWWDNDTMSGGGFQDVFRIFA